jgi:4-amino-4-deoxy-L-arabinose transferase-like glycosyltransferase
MIVTGNIPLVGIPSSHPWLHQGALWTYLLAGVLPLFSFNPISGAYLTIGFHLLTILLIYLFGSRMFSQRVGIIASLLYATSPLTTFFARMPYHTSPISFFTLIYLFTLYQWVKGRKKYFPLIIGSLALLYNLEIATFLLTINFLTILVFGIWKKKEWARTIVTRKIVVFSLSIFLIAMLPMLLYDIGHGFPQTVQFISWIGYKVLVFFGYPPTHPEIPSTTMSLVMTFLASSYVKLVYLPSTLVAFTIAVVSFGFFYKNIFDQLRSKKYSISLMFLGITFTISLAGIIATRTVSEAYLPILFPLIIYIVALFFDTLLQRRPKLAPVIVLIIGIIAGMNMFSLVSQNYFMGKGSGFVAKLSAARHIVSEADGKAYTIVGKGPGSQYQSFTMNYAYLTWWLGNGPSNKKEKLQFTIQEDTNGITIKKYD